MFIHRKAFYSVIPLIYQIPEAAPRGLGYKLYYYQLLNHTWPKLKRPSWDSTTYLLTYPVTHLSLSCKIKMAIS